MKVKLYNKLKAILICIIAFTILFSSSFVKATDDENTSSGTNRIYAVTTRDTTYQSTSTPGNPINATIMVPNGTTTSIPLVVMCHGYTGNRRNDDDHFIRLGSLLAQNGIAAVTIDFPGCGDSTAAESAYTLSNMYEYVNTAISNMTSEFDIDTSKIGIVGHSMGGRVASMYTQTGSYSVSAVALWAPANGDGSMGYDFLNKGSFSFGASDTFFSEMDNSYPNSVLSSYSGAIFLAEDGADARGEGPIDSSIVEQTKNTVSSQGGEVKDYSSTNHNFNDSVGNGGQVVNDTANFFGQQFLGRDITESSGEKYQEPLYTIEDIIFNRIPILDINFFTDTAAGQPVSEGSAVGVIRNTVSIWYVSFRNLVIIALAILIIYIGIRMAISTIPNDKAKYKTMMIGWIQALVIVIVIHMVMIMIININNSLVSLLEKASQDMMTANGWIEESVYETIRTRAYDLRLSVGLPATIIYVALVVIWVKFLWVYIKRSFTILILVIIAPFIGAKYALDSAKGKKGSSFSSWLYDFTLNVLLQTVHSIVYTVLMTAAINFAFSSVVGYIIALVFMNFMLEADDIFRSIFNFESKSDLAEEAARKENRKEVMQNFAGAIFVGNLAKSTWGFAVGLGGSAVRTGRRFTRFVGRTFPNASEAVSSRVNSTLNEIDTRVENAAANAQNRGYTGDKSGNAPNTWRNQTLKAIQKQAQLRRLSREKGVVGVKARQIKNSISKNRKKRFKANINFIKKAAVGTVSTLLAAPMAIVNPVAGLTMFTTGLSTLKKNKGKKHYKARKDGKIIKQSDMDYKAEKYTKKRDKQYSAVDLLDEINKKETSLEEKAKEMKKLNENKFNSFKDDASSLLDEASKVKIESIIEDYIEENDITTIDNYSINDIIDAVSRTIGIRIGAKDSVRSVLAEKARTKVVFLRNKKEAAEQMNNNSEKPDDSTYAEGRNEDNSGNKYGGNNENKGGNANSQDGKKDSGYGYGKPTEGNDTKENSNNSSKDTTKDTSEKKTTTYKKDDIVKIIQESVAEAAIEDKEYQKVTKELFKLDNDIKNFEGKAKTKYRDANKFLEGL